MALPRAVVTGAVLRAGVVRCRCVEIGVAVLCGEVGRLEPMAGVCCGRGAASPLRSGALDVRW